MVKSITVHFDNNEMDILMEAKKEESWHDFIMTLVTSKKEVEQNDRYGIPGNV